MAEKTSGEIKRAGKKRLSKFSRREFLRLSGAATAGAIAGSGLSEVLRKSGPDAQRLSDELLTKKLGYKEAFSSEQWRVSQKFEGPFPKGTITDPLERWENPKSPDQGPHPISIHAFLDPQRDKDPQGNVVPGLRKIEIDPTLMVGSDTLIVQVIDTKNKTPVAEKVISGQEMNYLAVGEKAPLSQNERLRLYITTPSCLEKIEKQSETKIDQANLALGIEGMYPTSEFLYSEWLSIRIVFASAGPFQLNELSEVYQPLQVNFVHEQIIPERPRSPKGPIINPPEMQSA